MMTLLLDNAAFVVIQWLPCLVVTEPVATLVPCVYAS